MLGFRAFAVVGRRRRRDGVVGVSGDDINIKFKKYITQEPCVPRVTPSSRRSIFIQLCCVRVYQWTCGANITHPTPTSHMD